jgi:hypothetical protein
MNTQIVDAIAQLIKSLPDQERSLLRDRLLTDLLSPVKTTKTSDSHNIQTELSKFKP